MRLGPFGRILLAANVGTSESDRTGRGKTDAGAIETIRLLKEAGADINAADGQGRTAAHGATLWASPGGSGSCTRAAWP